MELIIKRRINGVKKKGLSELDKREIKDNKINIMSGRENKEAAKVFFKNKKERGAIWRRKEKMNEKYDLFVDEWLTIEDRKELQNFKVCI